MKIMKQNLFIKEKKENQNMKNIKRQHKYIHYQEELKEKSKKKFLILYIKNLLIKNQKMIINLKSLVYLILKQEILIMKLKQKVKGNIELIVIEKRLIKIII